MVAEDVCRGENESSWVCNSVRQSDPGQGSEVFLKRGSAQLGQMQMRSPSNTNLEYGKKVIPQTQWFDWQAGGETI